MSERPSVNQTIADCPTCLAYLAANTWSLVAACASVGIEHGMTTVETLGVHMSGYHEAGHQ